MADSTKKKSKIKNFFVECKSEMKKVTWPSKQQLLHNTGVIIVFVAIITIILSILDVAFAKLFQFLTGLL